MNIEQSVNYPIFGRDLLTVLIEVQLSYPDYQNATPEEDILTVVGYKPSGQRSFVRHGVIRLLQSPRGDQLLVVSRSRRGAVDVRRVDLTTDSLHIYTPANPDLKPQKLAPSVEVSR